MSRGVTTKIQWDMERLCCSRSGEGSQTNSNTHGTAEDDPVVIENRSSGDEMTVVMFCSNSSV